MKYITCSGCGEIINSPDKIGYYETGIMKFKLVMESTHLYYEFDKFETDGGGEWYCKHCGLELNLSFEEGKKYYLDLCKQAEEVKNE